MAMANFSDDTNSFQAEHDLTTGPSMLTTPGTLRVQLQALLDDKERQLRLAGTLGQRVLAQQMELEERISQLNDLETAKTSASDDDEIESEIRDKLQDLKITMSSWENENQEMFGGLANKVNGAPPSPPSTPLPLQSLEDPTAAISPVTGPSAAQSSRRAKNAAHRANDVEFAFEIGSSLLTEVRRLQSLLGERDKAIQDMKEEKDDIEKLVENLRTGLRTQEANADKYKEENWNMEVAMQELRTQLSDAQTTVQNSEAERKRTAKQLVTARDSVDQHKNEAERLTSVLAEFKAKHETDVAQMRKQAAGLQRDKSDLHSALEALKSDIAKKERSIKRFGSPLTPNGLSPYTPNTMGEGDEGDDVFGTTGGASNRRKMDSSALFGPDALDPEFADSSPDPSPSRPHLAPNHPSNEIEALKQSLAHAQRQVNMLRGTVQREKEMRIEYKRKLVEFEGKRGGKMADEDDEEENVDPMKPRMHAAGGRGRIFGRHGRSGRLAFSQRLAMHPGTPESDFLDDIDETEIAHIPVVVSDLTSEQEEKEQNEVEEAGEDSSLVHSRRVSAEGMDPAFANVLRNPPPSPTPLPGSNPLGGAPSVSARGGRRARGGALRQPDERPPSVVEPAGALAAELGMTEEGMVSEFASMPETAEEILVSPVVSKPETAEFACQTELEQIPETILMPIPPQVDMCDICIQVDDPTPTPVTSTAEVSLQVTPVYIDATTDALVETRSEVCIQTTNSVTVDVDTQTLPTETYRAPLPISVSTTFTTLTRRGTLVPGTMFSGTDEEGEVTEPETEGEYTDAREFMTTATPTTDSVADFYSVRTGQFESNTDFHSVRTGPMGSTDDLCSVRTAHHGSDADDSDQESIKASRFARSRTTSRTNGYRTGSASIQGPQSPPFKTTAEESVQVEEKKQTVKEMSIQTDEWPPPAPAYSPPAFGLLRVGSHTQQFQYIPPSLPSPAGSPRSVSANTSRDSTSTVKQRHPVALSTASREHDRRPSIEAALSGDDAARVRTPSVQSQLTPVDKTRPPTMMLPPPPRMPPPVTMPDKKMSSSSSRDMPPPRDIPPPRPTSSPPPELIQRATTPILSGPVLVVPSRSQIRQHGASMPPSQHGLGNRPSTNSFRSAANAAAYASVSNAVGISTLEAVRRQRSTASLVSSCQSSPSRRSSVSSDHHPVRATPGPSNTAPNPPGRTLQNAEAGTTDPIIIHAITQTMIGEFLYKYTRRVVGKGHGEKRHRRFFWVHPYTKTLYWSSADPGSSNVSESSAKSAYIESVRSVLDPNPMPPGLYQYSVVVSTPQREMKITAPTKERHDIWFNALNYLLARPSGAHSGSPQSGRLKAAQNASSAYGTMRLPANDGLRKDTLGSPRSARSLGSVLSADSWNITPRAQRSQTGLSGNGSVGKRSGTPAAEYLRLGGPDGIASPSKSEYEYVPERVEDDQDLDFEIHDSTTDGEGFEGLENVRACCDGRHDLGTLSRKPHHHHHHHHHNYHPNHANPTSLTQNLNQETNEPVSRPVSPSAWSFRSRAGSTTSHGESTSIWSKFGSKRSKGVPPVPVSPSAR